MVINKNNKHKEKKYKKNLFSKKILYKNINSSLEDFFSYFFLLSFVSHTKIHATYVVQINYLLVNKK